MASSLGVAFVRDITEQSGSAGVLLFVMSKLVVFVGLTM